jgi:hypothetical protein
MEEGVAMPRRKSRVAAHDDDAGRKVGVARGRERRSPLDLKRAGMMRGGIDRQEELAGG